MRLHPTPPARRRGTILIVVLALLVLFSVIGLSFVLYSGSEATASRIYREAQDSGTTPPNPDAETPAIDALAQIIYDVPDGTTGMFSNVRGHSLARDVYGYYSTGTGLENTTAYNGVGGFDEALPGNAEYAGLTRARLVNYSTFGTGNGRRYFTPERTGSRFSPNAALPANSFYVGKNVNYTYPDKDHMFLGLANPINGQVLIPSFHRDWIFGSLNPTPGVNANWTNPPGKYLTLRPRPVDQNNGNQFPYPPPNADGTYTGDVQNLVGSVYPYLKNPNGNPGDPTNWQQPPGGPVTTIPKNDSIWVDTGYPVQYWNGKKYKTLFAFLVLPLNNRVNLSVSGNLKSTTAPNAHDSNQGFGPWEIDPMKVFSDPRSTSEYQRLIMDRYGAPQDTVSISPTNLPALIGVSTNFPTNPPGTLAAVNTRLFGSATPTTSPPTISTATPPDYAQVDWDGTGPLKSLMLLPGTGGFSSFATTPRWNDPTNLANARYGNGDPTQTSGGESFRHPSLFNPFFVPSAPSVNGHFYPASDLAKLNQKFGDDTGTSTTSSVGLLAPYSLGTWATSTMSASLPTYTVGRSPANATRMNVTTISNSLALPGLMPNFAGNTKNYTGYQFAAGLTFPIRTPGSTPALSPGVPGPDVSLPNQATPVQMRAIMAYLQGSVDLNRPLTDYRPALGRAAPLGPTNFDAVNYLQAWADRQLLARDIFNRLVVATGASATLDQISGYMIPNYSPGTPEFDALRYLAQLSANVVDFIDNDDISTAFVWNPLDPTQPLNVANFDSNPAGAGFVGNRVVFGVEKPKLVPNEVYAELVSDPNTSTVNTSTNHLIRFWVELLNPATNEPVAGKNLGAKPLPAVNQSTLLFDPANPTIKPYQLVVCMNGNALLNADLNPANRANVTGMYSAASNPVIKFDFSNTTSPAALQLAANGGVYGDTSAAAGVPGIAVVGPDASTANAKYEFNPIGTPPLNAAAAAGTIVSKIDPSGILPLNQMHLSINQLVPPPVPPLPLKEADIPGFVLSQNGNRPTVLLRRLMNPYLPANDPNDPKSFVPALPVNPYLTVDVFATAAGQQLVNDAVRLAADSNKKGAQRPATTPQPVTHYSFGRMQPFAGDPTFTAQQTPNPPSAIFPQTTFYRHNGATSAPTGPINSWPAKGETLWFPFEWMVHMDRPLVNNLEATFAAAVPSHQLTTAFLTPTGLKHQHLAPWTPDLAAPLAATLKLPASTLVDNAALYRGLELLTVKPWTYGTPNAGKVAGKINVNLITDPRILLALADPQGGNSFTQLTDLYDPAGGLNSTKFVFGRLMAARGNGAPIFQSAYDPTTGGSILIQVPGPNDTPIRSFGTATLETPNTFFTNASVPGIQGANSTPARTIVDPNGKEIGVFSLNNAAIQHPYQQQELLRKISNNLTTTTDTFAVYMTVGFFEVTNNPPYGVNNRPALGKEMFKDMPGDLRQRFYAVVDRTNLSIDPTDPTFRTQGGKPFVTELATAMPAGTATSTIGIVAQGGSATSVVLSFEGQALNILTGTPTPLRIGSGSSAELVTVTAASFDVTTGTGIGTLKVTRPAGATAHTAGERVMNNVIPGNPGPQSAFNPRSPNFQAVVPYFGKIE